ncbi:P-loop containing nucleoside triphosphate hydrolase, putative [Plasmodium malariae]|uniref:p-loop containing nucleoside triphosphate hydrolase, putative n=1 Tax=Plasmodium malariae TaxID=5858 RepID=A0A1D3SQ27_PLAMA|nr:P-loop containing nucleoside triphosphate hydrolase, putative [Plasmodium malariae]SCO93535.1 P-loop containing nucleoside triphosphate hydrolase, putative [Plasmodium malariae]
MKSKNLKSGNKSSSISKSGKNVDDNDMITYKTDEENNSEQVVIEKEINLENDYHNYTYVIEHLDFSLFCKKNGRKSDGMNGSSETKEEITKIDGKRLSFIGKTYDYLKNKNFNPKHLKKLEISQYFEKTLWAYYNMYDELYTLGNNSIFFYNEVSNERVSFLYIKHILSLIVFICYKYEEKGKYEIWDEIICNKIDEFEKLVEVEKGNCTEKENCNIYERYDLYKDFLIEKFNSLFFNTLKLINYNFVLNDFVENIDNKLENRQMGTKPISYRKNLYKLNFLEKSIIIQFFINIYSSIDKKFLFKLCVDLCNPFIWNHIHYDYLNKFLFEKNKEAKMLYNNLLKIMDKKYINGRSYSVLNVYMSNCCIMSQDDTSNTDTNEKLKNNGKMNHLEKKTREYDENIILLVNKSEFFYNLINYFLIVLDIIERKSEELDDLTSSSSSLSSMTDNEIENIKLDDYDNYVDKFIDENVDLPFSGKMKLNNDSTKEKTILSNGNTMNGTNDRSKEEVVPINGEDINCEENASKNGRSNKRTRCGINNSIDNYEVKVGVEEDEKEEEDDYLERYSKYASSEDEKNEIYFNHSEYKKEEILHMFSKYESRIKQKSKKCVREKIRENVREKKKKKKIYDDDSMNVVILFVEKCIEFFIDLLSQLYSRRVLYIFMKYFNVLIYCKISSLNKKRKFKELIKLLKYYLEMYINNFSGNPLTYLEINNEHYKNFEYFQIFCYKYFKDHKILKNYYLKSVFLMDKKKELLENFSKLEKEELLFLCENLKYIIVTPSEQKSGKKRCTEKETKGKEMEEESNQLFDINTQDNKAQGGKPHDDMSHNDTWNSSNNRLFRNVHIFSRKRKLFYITLLIENLSFKKNIFEEIDKNCDYPNEKDLFENVLIDTKDDLKKKRKTFLYTKPLFKLNLQYLCINDYIFRIYNLFKLQSYYDIRKNVIEYVYETNPKNKKVNENTICNYVFEIDENSNLNKSENEGERKIKKLYFESGKHGAHNNYNDDEGLKMNKKRKYEEENLEQNVNTANHSDDLLLESSNMYNEYQLNSIINDVNKIENTYFTNERRMSNKIDSFKIVNIDNNKKMIMGEIVIDLKYKYHERVHNEWNMIRPSDILFLVCVKNYTNHYKNKLNVINDNDLKKLLGINYVRGCEVIKYANFVEDDNEMDNEKCSMKKITVYLDYLQYQKDIINAPEIYSSFNLLVRRKQKENNFFYILNNIKTLIMNPDDAVIPYWVHDIFLGYCDNSLKYYKKTLPLRGEEKEENLSEENSESVSSNGEHSGEDYSDEDYSDEDDSDGDESNGDESNGDESNGDESNGDDSDGDNSEGGNYNQKSVLKSNVGKVSKKKKGYNKTKLNYIRKNIDDINYLNTFLNIKHILETTNVAYLCIDSSYINVSNGNSDKVSIKNLLNEYIEPLFLSYIPIKYDNQKNSLQKSVLHRNIIESLYYHICVINKYKVDDMNFISKFISNIKVAYHCEKFFVFQFEFKQKEYFLILNNYLNKVKEEEKNNATTCYKEGYCDSEEGAVINDHKNVKKIFDKIMENSIKYLSLKDGIYRIQNKIYDDENYPLEGLLIHTTKKNSTNIEFGNKEKDGNKLVKNKIHYTERQIECIKSGLYKGITIIEGVPGSGKTSILNKIINILFNNKKKEKILICTHSNSCLNYIFNLLVKENLIHQKYLCRVGMGELDIENLRNEYEEIEKSLKKNYHNDKDHLEMINNSDNILNDEDDNFNFSKYGRINYMIELRQKLLNEISLISVSCNNKEIFNCLSATQYYENNVKKRISKFFMFVDIFKKNANIDSFFKLYISSSIDDYDIYNLFLCPKMYVKQFENVEYIVWKMDNANVYCSKEIEELHILEEDKSCFYLIHPEHQLKILNLSIYNIIFPFKKYITLKLERISIDQYLDYKNRFADKNIGAEHADNLENCTGTNLSASGLWVNDALGKEKMEEEEEEDVENGEGEVERGGRKNSKGNAIQKNFKKEESLTNNEFKRIEEQRNRTKDNQDKHSIFKGELTGMTFKNNEDDLYVCKYYLAKLIKTHEHLNDCRAFEVLKNQRERGVYIIAKLARIIAMTCTHASINRSKITKLQFYFDNIIIDECTQITENDTFLPLLLQENRYDKSKLKRIIFVGDSNQLPPIIKNKYIKNFANYEQSLYKRFLRLELPSIYLNEQGRMRNEICNIYKYFYSKYNIQIANLECIHRDKFLKNFNPGFTYTYQFVHVESEEYTPVPYFYQNLLEAEMAVAIFMYMRLIGYSNEIITILTTYNGQKELILDILKKNCLYNKLIGVPKKVTTVDKYQGKQNDYVIISLVRSKSIGYMKNIKRLIVAFSRARFGLYVVGNYSLYKKNYEFKKPLYFFRKNKLSLSLQLNEHFNTKERDGNNSPVIIKDLNHFYTILYSLSNAYFQQGAS